MSSEHEDVADIQREFELLGVWCAVVDVVSNGKSLAHRRVRRHVKVDIQRDVLDFHCWQCQCRSDIRQACVG